MPNRKRRPSPRAGAGDRVDHQARQQQEEQGHEHLAHLLNALGHAPHHHHDAQHQKAQAPQQGLHRLGAEGGEVVGIGARPGAEVGAGGVDLDILEHPAPHHAVVGQDDKQGDDADVSREPPPGVQSAEGPHHILLGGPADGQLRQHDRKAHQEHDQQITQQEGAAAVGAHLAGKFPDVAQAHRGAGRGQDEAQVGGPLVPLFRHKSVPPHSNRIPSTIPQNSPFFKGNVRPGRTHPFPAREYDGSSHVEGRRIPCGMN